MLNLGALLSVVLFFGGTYLATLFCVSREAFGSGIVSRILAKRVRQRVARQG